MLETSEPCLQPTSILNDGSAEPSLKTMIEGTCKSIIADTMWSESSKHELLVLFTEVMIAMAEAPANDLAADLLYMPKLSEIIQEPSNSNIDHEKLVLETIVSHWTKVLASNDTERAGSGVFEEVNYWKTRQVHLSSLARLMNSEEFQTIINALNEQKSLYVDEVEARTMSISKRLVEAQDNVKHLSSLLPYFEALMDPSQVTEMIPKLLQQVRLISGHLQYNKTLVSGLLRSIAISCAAQCKRHISWPMICSTEIGPTIDLINDVVKCTIEWKSAYASTKANIMHLSEEVGNTDTNASVVDAWSLDENDERAIFAPLELLAEQSFSLLEICKARPQFTRSVRSLPERPEYSILIESLSAIESSFTLSMSSNELDLNSPEFYQDFSRLQEKFKELDTMYCDAVESAFTSIQHMETSLELLDVLHAAATRPLGQECIRMHTLELEKLFVNRCQSARSEFERYADNPPLEINDAPYSGAVKWTRSILGNLESHYQSLRGSDAMSVHQQGNAAAAYEGISAALTAYEASKYQDWIDSLDLAKVKTLPNVPVLVRSGKYSFKCNFPDELLLLCREAEFFHTSEEIPNEVVTLFQKQEEYRVGKEKILSIVQLHNDILDLLQGREYLLFSSHLARCEQAMRPGLTKVFFASRFSIVVKYVQAATPELNETYKVVQLFTHSSNEIERLCKQIGSLSFVHIGRDDMESFQSEQQQVLAAAKESVDSLHLRIVVELKKILSVLLINCTDQVQREVQLFASRIDDKIVKALHNSVKKSLSQLFVEMSDQDAFTLFGTKVLRTGDRVECRPSPIDITHAVNEVVKDVMKSAQTVPSLLVSLQSDLKLQSTEIACSLYNPDTKTSELVKMIMDIMAATTMELQKEVAHWDRYGSLLMDDKDAFYRKAKNECMKDEEIEAVINDYENQLREIEGEASSCTVEFIRVDYSPLKASLISECLEWLDMLKGLRN